jgi:hypothetical protein
VTVRLPNSFSCCLWRSRNFFSWLECPQRVQTTISSCSASFCGSSFRGIFSNLPINRASILYLSSFIIILSNEQQDLPICGVSCFSVSPALRRRRQAKSFEAPTSRNFRQHDHVALSRRTLLETPRSNPILHLLCQTLFGGIKRTFFPQNLTQCEAGWLRTSQYVYVSNRSKPGNYIYYKWSP